MMKRKNFVLFFVLISLIIVCIGCQQKSNEQKLDDYMNSLVNDSNQNASIAVMIIDQGKVVYKKAFGESNIDTHEKATCQTNYRIASMSKMFTAMGIMILKEEGKLDYDMYLSEIFDDFPDYGKDIQIRHLLNHESGLVSFYENTDLLNEKFDENHQLLDSDVYEIVKQSDSLYFQPGEKHEYSDTGYILLGLIIEKVSGQTLPDFMEEKIFDPLEMNDTLVKDVTIHQKITNRAYGTVYDGNKFVTRDQNFSSATRGDGSIYTSLDDLYKWDRGFNNDVIIKHETIDEMYSVKEKSKFSLYNVYNCGWYFYLNNRQQLEMMHGGGSKGFSSMYIKIPEEDIAIIILSNRENTPRDNRYTTHKIYREIPDKIREIYGYGKIL